MTAIDATPLDEVPASSKKQLLNEVHLAAMVASVHYSIYGLWQYEMWVYTAGRPNSWFGLRRKQSKGLMLIEELHQPLYLASDGYVYIRDTWNEKQFFRAELHLRDAPDIERVRDALRNLVDDDSAAHRYFLRSTND